MMRLLVILTQKVLSVQDSGSYIAVILGTTVIITKRRFDTFIVCVLFFNYLFYLFKEAQRNRMSEYRSTKRTRVGIVDANIIFKV
jgi:hypothetical protein